jgi:CRISPR-associated protein Cas1
MRATYQALAKKHRVSFRRQYTLSDFESADPVNQALSAANTCLYGVVGAALASLGIHPGLGIVHTGTRESLVYDIADLYKSEVTIPLAFSCADESNPGAAARRKLRDRITLTRLLPRIIRDIHHVYGLSGRGDATDPRDVTLARLWDGDGEVSGGVNYADASPSVMPADPEGVEEW